MNTHIDKNKQTNKPNRQPKKLNMKRTANTLGRRDRKTKSHRRYINTRELCLLDTEEQLHI